MGFWVQLRAFGKYVRESITNFHATRHTVQNIFPHHWPDKFVVAVRQSTKTVLTAVGHVVFNSRFSQGWIRVGVVLYPVVPFPVRTGHFFCCGSRELGR